MKVLVLDGKKLAVKNTIRDIREVVRDAECMGFTKEIDALRYSEKNTVNVAVLDIDMPKMNGISFADRLIKLQPRVNIIFLTNQPEYALDSYRVNASAFLLKPLDKTELKKAFANLRFPLFARRIPYSNESKASIIGRQIRQRRRELDISVKDLAKIMDVSFQTIYRWESGERIPDTLTLIELSDILDVNIENIIPN